MKNTIIATFIVLLLISSLSTGFAGSKEFCSKKWPNDYSMQEYCIEKQRKATVEILKLLASYGITEQNTGGTLKLNPPPAGDKYRTLFIDCLSKWETDKVMLLFCFEKQVEALQTHK
jgi:hypothetical protein